VAERLRRELKIEVAESAGRYGEFTVLVDGTAVASAGMWGFLGVLPSAGRVVRTVRERLAI
jgi:hypothetical protein